MTELLVIAGLSRSFSGVTAVDGLALTLAAGELRCIIGPNGCGKTTLFNLITGALRPDGGEIRFRGHRIDGLPPHRVARHGIGRKFQIPGVYPDLPVAENLRVARFARAGRGGLLGLARPASGWSADALLDLAGLTDRAGLPAGSLAHGQRQWLEIAMVLATEPALLLLDEPTTGLTEAETLATVDLVRRLHAESGIAAIVIEHDMRFVEALDCPVAFMDRGRIAREGSIAEIRDDPLVREAYLGRAA